MIAIENKDYIVSLNLKGGQISSFKNKKLDLEYIWSGDKDYWGYTSPTLFPIIGSSYDKKYHFNGQILEMENHGILRNADFDILLNTKDQAVLQYTYNDKTFKHYPYYFKILITYTLDFNKLNVFYEIYNDGVMDMPFNFGLHPAFNCPIEKDKQFSDYKIKFSSPTKLYGDGVLVNNGLVSEINLNREDFKTYPTMIYHNVNSSHVDLTDGVHGVRVSLVGFPILALWTPNDKQAPFVCIEPWLGVSKKVDKDLPFSDRDAIMIVEANKKRVFNYSISIY